MVKIIEKHEIKDENGKVIKLEIYEFDTETKERRKIDG